MFHWYIQRATSYLLLPAMLFSCFQLYSSLQPSMGVFMVNLFILLTLTYHLKLGFDSIIEDYVPQFEAQLLGRLVVNLACLFIIKVVLAA